MRFSILLLLGLLGISFSAAAQNKPLSGTSAASAASAVSAPTVASNTVDQRNLDTEGSNEIVVPLLFFMSALYLIQAGFAFRKASTHTIAQSTLKSITFNGGEALNKTWLAAAAILIIPFLLSWLPTLPHMHTRGDGVESRPGDVAAYYACVSVITVLITVELTLLFDMRGEGKKWQNMLVVAMGLDIVSLYLFTAYIESPKYWNTGHSSWAWLFMGMTGVSALASSFIIVLFSKSANEH